MDERPTKRRGPMTWLAGRSRRFRIGLAMLPVLYVASFGPACWISSRLQPSGRFVSSAYSPIIPVMFQGPMSVQYVLMRYVVCGLPDGGHYTLDGSNNIEFYARK